MRTPTLLLALANNLLSTHTPTRTRIKETERSKRQIEKRTFDACIWQHCVVRPEKSRFYQTHTRAYTTRSKMKETSSFERARVCVRARTLFSSLPRTHAHALGGHSLTGVEPARTRTHANARINIKRQPYHCSCWQVPTFLLAHITHSARACRPHWGRPRQRSSLSLSSSYDCVIFGVEWFRLCGLLW